MLVASHLRRVCVTGPESTGKTTLARRLAEHLHTEWVREASRVYAERVARALTFADVEPIAREHIALAEASAMRVRARGGQSLVLDTDLMSTIVYARHYFGSPSRWLDREARARRADVYLLCEVDVPWVPDDIRDRPANREVMFDLFGEALAEVGARVIIVAGDWESRWDIAVRAAQ